MLHDDIAGILFFNGESRYLEDRIKFKKQTTVRQRAWGDESAFMEVNDGISEDSVTAPAIYGQVTGNIFTDSFNVSGLSVCSANDSKF